MTTRDASRTCSLGGEFKGVTLQRWATGAVTIDVSALSGADVTVITGGAVRVLTVPRDQTNQPNALPTTVDGRAYAIGDVLPDGWIVGPASPDTGIVMSIEPASGALNGYETWYRGQHHAAALRDEGHANARQPTESELNALYNEVVKAGRNGDAKFSTSVSSPYGSYWASTTDPDDRDDARMQYFADGDRGWGNKNNAVARVRCVRDQGYLALS